MAGTWIRHGWVLAGLAVAAPTAADWGINLPPPVTPAGREIYDLHMMTFWIATVIMIIVTVIVAWSVWAHRKSRGVEPDLQFHESWFGRWGWISVPVLVLAVDLTIAGAASRTLERVWYVPDNTEMDVKIIGHQWWWEYEYLDHDIRVESRALGPEEAGEHYLRAVDNPMVLPVGVKVRFLHTASDVLHAFWIPELGFKKDAIPGYITETWALIEEEGIYRGQCAELCGTWHARMPAVVKAVSRDEFDLWVAEQRAAQEAALVEASADREWDRAELMARGEREYNTRCAACHQVSGQGMPPTFPSLVGTGVVTGDLAAHVELVLNGVPGTAMTPFRHLNDLELAAIITYERNAWGNDTGDVIQPRDIAGMRGE